MASLVLFITLGCGEQTNQRDASPPVEETAELPTESKLNGEKITAEGYSIIVPDGWEVLEEVKTIFTLRAPRDDESDTFGENIRVLRYRVGQSFTVDQVLQRQKSDTGRFELVGEGRVDKAVIPMVWMALAPSTPQNENDDRVKVDFITTQGTDVVTLVAVAERKAWESYMPIFKQIASTFKPLR